MSPARSKRLADLTVQVPGNLGNKERFNNFYLNVLHKAKFHHFVNEFVLNRKRKSPDYPILQYVKGYNKSDKDYHPDTPKTHYRQLYYEALDRLINSLKERSTQPSFVAYEMVESFLFKSLADEDLENEEKNSGNRKQWRIKLSIFYK